MVLKRDLKFIELLLLPGRAFAGQQAVLLEHNDVLLEFVFDGLNSVTDLRLLFLGAVIVVNLFVDSNDVIFDSKGYLLEFVDLFVDCVLVLFEVVTGEQ